MPNLDFPNGSFEIQFTISNLKDVQKFLSAFGCNMHYDWIGDEYCIRCGRTILKPVIGDILVYSDGELTVKKGDENA